MKFALNNSMLDITTSELLKNYSKYLMYQNPNAPAPGIPDGVDQLPISEMKEVGWSPEGIINGVNTFVELIQNDQVKQYFVYDESERNEPQMECVNFIHLMPGKADPSKPAIILCAGGAYYGVCTMVESLPTARHFVEAGYQVFLFTYRVGEEAVTLRAIDDLARGIRYLCENKEELQINPNRLVLGGFSAGANLISYWGTTNMGYQAYDLPKPLALLPIYTFIDLKEESKRDENGGLLVPMFGPDFQNMLDQYNIAEHVDDRYPPCYIVAGKNDTTVPCRNSELLKSLLDQAGVPAVLELGENAPHGFGDGTGTDVEGWPERAIEFMENLSAVPKLRPLGP